MSTSPTTTARTLRSVCIGTWPAPAVGRSKKQASATGVESPRREGAHQKGHDQRNREPVPPRPWPHAQSVGRDHGCDQQHEKPGPEGAHRGRKAALVYLCFDAPALNDVLSATRRSSIPDADDDAGRASDLPCNVFGIGEWLPVVACHPDGDVIGQAEPEPATSLKPDFGSCRGQRAQHLFFTPCVNCRT